MIGVAIVGTGFGQKVHIPAFQAHHKTQIIWNTNQLPKIKVIPVNRIDQGWHHQGL